MKTDIRKKTSHLAFLWNRGWCEPPKWPIHTDSKWSQTEAWTTKFHREKLSFFPNSKANDNISLVMKEGPNIILQPSHKKYTKNEISSYLWKNHITVEKNAEYDFIHSLMY